jgi:photosystem II stability/assembly factor-like uncharacterized protein
MRSSKQTFHLRRATLAAGVLPALVLLSAPVPARTIDRDPVPGTLVRRFSVPVIDAVLGSADGRRYARASDRLAGGGTLPRSLWWTRAPGESRWTLLNDGPSPFYPALLAPDPLRPGLVYAADPTTGSISRSLDGGATWEALGTAPGGEARQLLVVGTDLLLEGDGRFCVPCRSGDGGRSWETSTAQAGETLASGGDPAVVYSFSTAVIHRSADGGRSFSDVSPAPSQGALALAVSSADPDVVYALAPEPAGGFLLRTADGGSSWQRLAPPAAGLAWSAPAVDPASVGHLATLGGPADASAPRRLFESVDGGLTWTAGPEALGATELVFSGSTIEAFGRRGLFDTADHGARWTQADRGISADSALLLAGTGQGGLYVANPESGALWISRDQGRSWEARGSRPGLQSLAVDPFDPTRLVGLDRTVQSLSWSDDGGRTWTSRKGPRKRAGSLFIASLAFDPHRRNTIYAATVEDAWRSEDRGVTWTLFTGSLRSGTDCTTFHCFKIRDVESIVPDPRMPGRFYAVAHTYETFRSGNGGATWKPVRGPELAASDAPRVLPDPRVKDHLYWGVRVETKVFESLRAGEPPWRTVLRTANFAPLNDAWLTFDPAGRLVVAPQGNVGKFLRRLQDTDSPDWEGLQAVLPLQEDVRLLDPLVRIPGGARMFLLVPGLGLFRADVPEP